MKLKNTLLALALVFAATAFSQDRKGNFHLSPDGGSHIVYVSFKGGSLADINEVPGFAALAQQYAIVPQKGIAIAEDKLAEMESTALKITGNAASVSRLRNIYRLEIADPTNARMLELATALEKLDSVDYCSLMPTTPIQPPYDIAPITPLFEAQQGYIEASAVNMRYAWDMGLNGQGINLKDVEYGVNIQHEEFNERNISHAMAISPEATVDFQEHGTAVFGIVYADKGSYGISGMAHGANEMVLYTEYPVSGYNRVNAVAYSIDASSAGDIIVFELQTYGPTDQFCPAEYENVIWDLTKAASDAGIVIVAAAGNGNQNLDSASYYEYLGRGDSGAIVVGAGTNNQNRQRLSFSTYGSRVNVQGWGQGVYTSGYGDALQVGGDFNQNYTNFSGTSSATPIVASCVAVLQSYYHGLTGEYLTGVQMRDLLVETGKQQGNIWQGYIGPLPDMEGAITQIANMLGAPTHEKASFSVYPNPVQERLSVNVDGFSGDVKAEVYNALGQLVNARAMDFNGQEIDFSGLSAGIYFVKVSDGEITLTQRVIKK